LALSDFRLSLEHLDARRNGYKDEKLDKNSKSVLEVKWFPFQGVIPTHGL